MARVECSCLLDINLPAITLVESLVLHADAAPEISADEEAPGHSFIPTYTDQELQHHQRSDPVIAHVIWLLEAGKVVDSNYCPDSLELKLMFK